MIRTPYLGVKVLPVKNKNVCETENTRRMRRIHFAYDLNLKIKKNCSKKSSDLHDQVLQDSEKPLPSKKKLSCFPIS